MPITRDKLGRFASGGHASASGPNKRGSKSRKSMAQALVETRNVGKDEARLGRKITANSFKMIAKAMKENHITTGRMVKPNNYKKTDGSKFYK